MYFPRKQRELNDYLRHLDNLPCERKIREIEEMLENLSHWSHSENDTELSSIYQILYLAKEQAKIEEKLYRIRKELEYREHEIRVKERELEEKRKSLEEEFRQKEIEHKIKFFMVPTTKKSEVRGYKNLHIYLFSHPNNHSSAAIEILSSMNYLDKMTRNIFFTVPGYKIAETNEDIVNPQDKKMPLSFDEDVFIKFVQDLEDKTKGGFVYQNDCELVIIGQKPDGEYDNDSMARINIDRLAKQKTIDPVKLLMAVSQKFRSDNSEIINAKQIINEIIGEMCTEEERPMLKVFVAGAKKMETERRIVREQLGILENEYNLDIRALTFEDFPVSLKGGERGRQTDYNKFIREEANIVVFIFGSIAGRITEEEFEVAYESLKDYQHPDVFVYVKKQFFMFDKRLRNIKNKVFGENKEYYVEYKNHDNLCYLFYSNMNAYLKDKQKNGI